MRTTLNISINLSILGDLEFDKSYLNVSELIAEDDKAFAIIEIASDVKEPFYERVEIPNYMFTTLSTGKWLWDFAKKDLITINLEMTKVKED